MKTFRLAFILAAVLVAAFHCIDASAQFSQEYNATTATAQDSTDTNKGMFSFREYFGGLQHKNTMKIGTMFAGSTVFIGGTQIYNKQYWKLPLVYSGIAGCVGAGIYMNSRGNSTAATWCFVGAGVAYWATLMDGVLNYEPADYPHAGKAALFSLLVPGLGQIYNKEYWKVPVYLGLMGFGVHYYFDCRKNFLRFRSIYLEASEAGSSYTGPVTSTQAIYYRNIYRRYRDYALLAVVAVYILQIIDANVFAYMHNFEVTDDISMNMSPTVILPDNQFAWNSGAQNAAVGLRLGFTF